MDEQLNKPVTDDGCTQPPEPIPASKLAAYSVDSDRDSEQDIARYVELEAHEEQVQHVERIKQEVVMGIRHDVYDVVTDKDRYWVITEPTNLYSQKDFPSLDFTLSFHVGLMMRVRSRPRGADADEPSPFDEVFRRQQQAKHRYERAVEAVDYQAVGMQLRESLISLVAAVRRRVELDPAVQRPQDANVKEWSELLLDKICSGGSNQRLRRYLKSAAAHTWDLVNWLTHDRDANDVAASISIDACDVLVGHFVELVMRDRTAETVECPICRSRNVRTHYDHLIEPDGDYYTTCGECDWSTHPVGGPDKGTDAD